MLKLLLASLALIVVIARCSCSEDSPTGDTPDPNPTNSSIESRLIGTWHRYSAAGSLLTAEFARFTRDSISITGYPVMTGLPDSDPQFARALVAASGQIFYDPACNGCADEYHFDYTFGQGDSVLYIVHEITSTATAPGPSSDNVIILRRVIDTTAARPLAIISDSLRGTWDQYDSSGTTLTQSALLRISRDSIVYTRGSVSITFKGVSDPEGTTGRTLVARNGQIWYDYHFEGNNDMYRFDYSLSPNATIMYLINEETSTYTSPGAQTDNLFYCKKR